MVTIRSLLSALMVCSIWLVGTGALHAAEDVDSTIHTVLPKDAIAAIVHPAWLPAQQAQVAPGAAMIGVMFNGEAHAYSAVLLNAHEIVNDVVGGEKVATTW